jgi:threonyl-tRNA synthetase
LQSESMIFIDLLHQVYEDFGFKEVTYKLATRPANRIGADDVWDKAEKALGDALDARGLPWSEKKGEGAFYGPKIEFTLRDQIGRYWQCGTLQVDFSMPGRLGATYVAQDGSKQVPVMLHRAIFGSIERFIGILIEEHAGSFPAWLAPVQAVVMNITDAQADYVSKAVEVLKNHGLRVESDLRNEKVGFKIREHTLRRIPYLLVAGDREAGANTLAVRTRAGKDLGAMSLEALAEQLAGEVASRGRTILGAN